MVCNHRSGEAVKSGNVLLQKAGGRSVAHAHFHSLNARAHAEVCVHAQVQYVFASLVNAHTYTAPAQSVRMGVHARA
mgnify:CR=1 FL=1